MSTRIERLSGELVARYVCATLVTVIAAAGAQLVVRTDFALVIVALSVVGALVSLFLRVHGMRVAGFTISRPLWNGLTSLAWFGASALWTVSALSDLMNLVMSGQSYWVRFGAGESLSLLMQVFLLFSAFRSFALISDKDATLATVPSFSVLLLLIPIHKGMEVVLYFLAWTLTATVLFALDHRSELASSVDGRVPAMLPGQDVRLAARGLVTVLASALGAAFVLSFFLTSRNPDDRSSTESAITSLAGRLAQFAFSTSSDASGSYGPERQIDFSTGPALPSRMLLWKALAVALDGEQLRPEYFRLFTLTRYNGSAWMQTNDEQKRVGVTPLSAAQWPRWKGTTVYGKNRSAINGKHLINDRFLPDGFAIGPASAGHMRLFGSPRRTVRMRVESNATNLGFVPLLPGVQALSLVPPSNIQELRVRRDGAVDLGFIAFDQKLRSVGDVPDLFEYGGRTSAPLHAVVPTAGSPQLSPQERAELVRLPPSLSERVRLFARHALEAARPGESNLRHAQRLALAIQDGATYTLHPPTPPEGVESTGYFLFEGGKRGYCTHFASALTVLCRSQGIPARVVSGFVANEHDGNGFALLRDANAHAWTEVWVEHWGWALVDATPTQDRGDNAPNWLSLWSDWLASLLSQMERWSRARIWLVSAGIGIVLAALYAFRRRARFTAWWAQRKNKAGESEWSRREIIAAYESASLELTRHFRPRAPSETPDEWLLAATRFAQTSPRSLELPFSQLRDLTELYLRARYAPEAPQVSLVTVARELAAHLKWKKPASS